VTNGKINDSNDFIEDVYKSLIENMQKKNEEPYSNKNHYLSVGSSNA
jgi:hypothetical protein